MILLLLFSIWYFLQPYTNFLEFQNLYEQEKYSQAMGFYDNSRSPEALHNLWNASYMMFTESENNDIEALRSAQKLFSGSLHIQEHPDTRYNYIFVSLLLSSLEPPKQSQEQNQREQSQDWQENSHDTQWETSSGNTTQQQNVTNRRDQQYYLDEDDSLQSLSWQEQQQLEQYIEWLKRQQSHNQKYFWKQPQWNNFNDIFENFFGDIHRGGEKDW